MLFNIILFGIFVVQRLTLKIPKGINRTKTKVVYEEKKLRCETLYETFERHGTVNGAWHPETTKEYLKKVCNKSDKAIENIVRYMVFCKKYGLPYGLISEGQATKLLLPHDVEEKLVPKIEEALKEINITTDVETRIEETKKTYGLYLDGVTEREMNNLISQKQAEAERKRYIKEEQKVIKRIQKECKVANPKRISEILQKTFPTTEQKELVKQREKLIIPLAEGELEKLYHKFHTDNKNDLINLLRENLFKKT